MFPLPALFLRHPKSNARFIRMPQIIVIGLERFCCPSGNDRKQELLTV
jgi:hypothetical protein